MDKLLQFLNALKPDAREGFAKRCGTTEGYIRKAVCTGQKLRESVCIAVERETDRQVTVEDLRPDVDWAVLRGTGRRSA